eukprot:TRINITY_DN21162_c0_g1_i1.p1 TRINITY_DN21162_c0_g1~~TRINITY_DN21162_c0_g1_i1.p1  ORF type:complete len:754 (-),score=66.99 TRINITY_DN21162_c0_g1_i1:38-2299(-)
MVQLDHSCKRLCEMHEGKTASWGLVAVVVVMIPYVAGYEERRPMFDYDCVSVHAPPLVDWSVLHEELQDWVRESRIERVVPSLRPSWEPILWDHQQRALKECPLAVLNIAIVYFYTATNARPDTENMTDALDTTGHLVDLLIEAFPIHKICSSRWPVFEVLEMISHHHEDEEWQPHRCGEDGGDNVVDWDDFRTKATAWAVLRLTRLGDEKVEMFEKSVHALILEVAEAGDVANSQCPFGYAFALISVALSTATRRSQHFNQLSTFIDDMVNAVGFHAIVSSQWPVASALAWLSDMNKGLTYVVRDPKYLRRFGDLDLRAAELSPIVVPPTKIGTAAGAAWRSRGARIAATLARLPQHRFESILRSRARSRATRPILRTALAAIISATRSATAAQQIPRRPSCLAAVQQSPEQERAQRWRRRQRCDKSRASSVSPLLQGHGRRAVALTLVYGSSWSPLLRRIVPHLRNLGFWLPLLVVSIGQDATDICQDMARRGATEPPPTVSCWTPDTTSQVHRFTITHMLLHLGVDVFYFDLDTFFLRNPLPRVMGQARRDNLDALFSSHADGDCVNIGVFYIRSSKRSTIWFSQFLDWYHNCQWEIDQRGLNILLQSPLRQNHSRLGITFQPHELKQVRVGVLEDRRQFVIGFIGWTGQVSELVIFHWCNLPLERKWAELSEVYDAAEAIRGHMPFNLALATVLPSGWRPPPRAPSDPPPEAPRIDVVSAASAWSLVRRSREIFDAYWVSEFPERGVCW